MTSTPNSPSSPSPSRSKPPSKHAKELVPDSEEENGAEESATDDSTRQDSADVDEGDDSVDGEVEVSEPADADPTQLVSKGLSDPSTTFTPSEDLQERFSANYHHHCVSHSEARARAKKYNHLSCERCKKLDLVCKPVAGNRATACTNCSLSSREPCSNTEDARRDRLKTKFNLDDAQYEVLRRIYLSKDRPKRSTPKKKQNAKSVSTTKTASSKEIEEEEEVSDEGEDELDDEVEEEEVTVKRRKVTVHRDEEDDKNSDMTPLDEDEGSPEPLDESQTPAREHRSANSDFMPSKDLQEQFSASYYYGAHNEAREWIKANGHLPCERCKKLNLKCSMPPGLRATKCNNCATGSRAPCSKTEDARRARLKAKFHLDDTQYDILREVCVTKRPKRSLATQKSTKKVANERSPEKADGEQEAREDDDAGDPEENSETEEEVVTAKKKNKAMVPKTQLKVGAKKKQSSTLKAGLRAGERARKPTAKAAANIIPEKPINNVSAPRRTMSRLPGEDLEDSDDDQPLERQFRHQPLSTQRTSKNPEKAASANTQPCTPHPSTSTTLAGNKRRRPSSFAPSDCSTLVDHSTVSTVATRPPRPSSRNNEAMKRRIEDASTRLRYKRTFIQDLLNEYDAIANEVGELGNMMDVDPN